MYFGMPECSVTLIFQDNKLFNVPFLFGLDLQNWWKDRLLTLLYPQLIRRPVVIHSSPDVANSTTWCRRSPTAYTRTGSDTTRVRGGRVEEREAAPLLVGRGDWPDNQYGNVCESARQVSVSRDRECM